MGRNRHKRKNSHVVIVTSDAADIRMKQFRIRPWMLQTIIIIVCIFVCVCVCVCVCAYLWGH